VQAGKSRGMEFHCHPIVRPGDAGIGYSQKGRVRTRMRVRHRVSLCIVLLSVLTLVGAGTVLADSAVSINLWSWNWAWRCLDWRMRYNIDIVNEGDTTLHNVYISDPLPEGTCVDDTITTQGYYYRHDGNGAYSLVWELGDLEPGESVQKWLELQTWDRREPNLLINTAYVFCDELLPVSSTYTQEYVSWPVECGGSGTPPLEYPLPRYTPTPGPTLPEGWEQRTFHQGLYGYAGTDDTYLSSSAGERGTNFAREGGLALCSGSDKVALARFDLSAISPDALVSEALLDLTTVEWLGGEPLTINIYKVTRPWVVTETTWISASASTPWGVAGCSGEDDHGLSPVASFLLERGAIRYSIEVTELVSEWVQEPERNQGIVLKSVSDTGMCHSLASAEYYAFPDRPQLSVIFLPGESTPTPTPTLTLTPTATPTSTLQPTVTTFQLNMPVVLKGI